MARNFVPGREVAEIISATMDFLATKQHERLFNWLLEKVIITKDSNPHNRGPWPGLLQGWSQCRDRDMEGLVLLRKTDGTWVTPILRRFLFEARFSVYRDEPSVCCYVNIKPLEEVDEKREELLVKAGLND